MDRKKSDYAFEISPVYSNSALAAGFAVLHPLYGRRRRGPVQPLLLGLVRRWRMRLQALREAGWQRINSEKFAYARNCRPCISQVSPSHAKACCLRICPFCHARFVEAVYNRARAVLERHRDRDRPLAAVSYSRVYTRKETEAFHFGDDLAAQLLLEVVPQHRQRRSLYRDRVLGRHHGNCHWIAIEPVLSHDLHTGAWQVRHGNLALVDPDWEPPPLRGTLVRRCAPTGRQLAWLVARTFRYPYHWMAGNEQLLATLLNVTASQRFCTRTGVFRGDHE